MNIKIFFCIFLICNSLQALSQNGEMEFDNSLIEFSIVNLFEGDKDTVKVSLTILKKDSTFIYYNYQTKGLSIFSNTHSDFQLNTRVDTLLYIHYYIHRYAFTTEWAKTFRPYSKCSGKVRKEGNCMYHYHYPFVHFNKEIVAKFTMVKGGIIDLVLSYEGRQRILMKSDFYLFH